MVVSKQTIEICDLLGRRLQRIIRLAGSIPSDVSVGLLAWLGWHAQAKLRNLTTRFAGQDFKRYFENSTASTDAKFHIPQSLVDRLTALVSVKALEQEKLERVVDNFLLHELIHSAQGMGEGNHTGIAASAPDILNAIDYEADAGAIFIALVLELLESKHDHITLEEAWYLYPLLIEAAVLQTYMFFLVEDDPSPDLSRAHEKGLLGARWQRFAGWHLQFHRALRFDAPLGLAEFQIFFPPIIYFRNRQRASSRRLLNRHWPRKEFEYYYSNDNEHGLLDPNIHQHRYRISTVNCFGLRRHTAYSHTLATDEALFDGVFRGDVMVSKPFFDALFDRFPGLTGGMSNPVDPRRPNPNGGGGGGGGPIVIKKSDRTLEDVISDLCVTFLAPRKYPAVVAEALMQDAPEQAPGSRKAQRIAAMMEERSRLSPRELAGAAVAEKAQAAADDSDLFDDVGDEEKEAYGE